jgi:hypothetical protein
MQRFNAAEPKCSNVFAKKMAGRSPMIEKHKDAIKSQLGDMAWFYISNGAPKEEEGWIYFWMVSQECSWGIDTDPPLLMACESGKEFTNFENLFVEVAGVPF